MVLPRLAGIGGSLRRTIADTTPAVVTDPFAISRGYFALLRSFYENDAFSDAQLWQAYKSLYRLNRNVRSIFNPTRRAVDAYPGHVYPGAWTEDGKPLPDGTPHALQFPSDILDDRPELAIAAIQTLGWGNWAAERMTYVREGAIIGTVFVEVVDDLERRKVYPEIVPIERLADVTLDATGNVKGYELRYQAIDRDTGQTYAYRKVVDRDGFIEYRDNATLAESPNPYGFVPAALVKHRNTGSLFGAPAIAGVIPKIDEVNRLATDVHNEVGKAANQPVVFWSEQPPVAVNAAGQTIAAAEDSRSAADAVRAQLAATQEIKWLWGRDSPDTKGRVEPMMQYPDISAHGEQIARLLDEIKADLPEITMDEIISKLPNASGPIIDRMLPGARSRIAEAQANYDAGTIKLIQMGVAIAGWRVNTGAWGARSQLDRQQVKFVPYSLESYAAGDLDMALLPRPLVPTTETERLMALQLRKEVAGLSNDAVRRALGMSDEEIAEMTAELERESERLSVSWSGAY